MGKNVVVEAGHAETRREAAAPRPVVGATRNASGLEVLGRAAGNAAMSRLFSGLRPDPAPVQREPDPGRRRGGERSATAGLQPTMCRAAMPVSSPAVGIVPAPMAQRLPDGTTVEADSERPDLEVASGRGEANEVEHAGPAPAAQEQDGDRATGAPVAAGVVPREPAPSGPTAGSREGGWSRSVDVDVASARGPPLPAPPAPERPAPPPRPGRAAPAPRRR